MSKIWLSWGDRPGAVKERKGGRGYKRSNTFLHSFDIDGVLEGVYGISRLSEIPETGISGLKLNVEKYEKRQIFELIFSALFSQDGGKRRFFAEKEENILFLSQNFVEFEGILIPKSRFCGLLIPVFGFLAKIPDFRDRRKTGIESCPTMEDRRLATQLCRPAVSLFVSGPN